MSKYLTVLLLFFSPTVLMTDGELKSFFIVWNVGQGQWATLVLPDGCHHFDVGGEKNPLARVQKICGKKKNKFYLSHWDWDHISFALKAHKALPQACLKVAPLGKSRPYKMKILETYKSCDAETAPEALTKELTSFTSKDLTKKTNDLSRVLVALDKILIPGDSPQVQEKIWGQRVSPSKIRLLLLGHHGSQTSSSEELLSLLPDLKMAVASARSARYGHPHPVVVQRLKKHHIPLLRTEDWGNLWFTP